MSERDNRPTKATKNPKGHANPKKNKDFYREIKGPDKLQKAAAGWLDYALQNKKLLVGLGVGFVVLSAVALGINYFQKSQAGKLREELAAIDKGFRSEAKLFQERIAKTQELVETKRTQKVDLEKAKDKNKDAIAALENDIKNLQADLEKMEPDHSKSFASFAAFYKEHPQAPEGFWAGMKYVAHLIDKDKSAEAQPILENIMKESKGYPIYQVQGNLLLLAILENEKKYDEALQLTDSATTSFPKDLQPRLLLAKGRILLAKNDKAEALKVLDTIIKDHKNAREAEMALTYKALAQ